VEIRRLRASDDRSRFRSDDPDLERFFRSYAGQNQFRHQQLLRFAFGLALAMTEDYGCVGVALDAKPGAEAFYARYGFRGIDVVEGLSGARPRPTPMFLPSSEILASTPRRSKR